jgi:hypothetical protein
LQKKHFRGLYHKPFKGRNYFRILIKLECLLLSITSTRIHICRQGRGLPKRSPLLNSILKEGSLPYSQIKLLRKTTNTLAYCNAELMMAVKSFMELAPDEKIEA